MRRLYHAIEWARGLWALGLCMAAAFVPVSMVETGPSLCLFKLASGHDCPACGITRALVRSFHGDLAGALECNRAVMLVLPLLLTLAGWQLSRLLNGTRQSANSWPALS